MRMKIFRYVGQGKAKHRNGKRLGRGDGGTDGISDDEAVVISKR